jgi:uncharacterized membrane protein
MDTDFIIKLVTAIVAAVGALLGLLSFSTTRRSVGYQNLKTEIELLTQSIAFHEAESDYKKFLIDVRKEKISSLVFGITIPNADLERIYAYYKKAEGNVTTGDIAKAWLFRDTRAEQLTFQLRGSHKTQYIIALLFMLFCMLSAFGGFVALIFGSKGNEVFALVCVSLFALFNTGWINRGLFMAAHLGKLEKERHRIPNDA